MKKLQEMDAEDLIGHCAETHGIQATLIALAEYLEWSVENSYLEEETQCIEATAEGIRAAIAAFQTI